MDMNPVDLVNSGHDNLATVMMEVGAQRQEDALFVAMHHAPFLF